MTQSNPVATLAVLAVLALAHVQGWGEDDEEDGSGASESGGSKTPESDDNAA